MADRFGDHNCRGLWFVLIEPVRTRLKAVRNVFQHPVHVSAEETTAQRLALWPLATLLRQTARHDYFPAELDSALLPGQPRNAPATDGIAVSVRILVALKPLENIECLVVARRRRRTRGRMRAHTAAAKKHDE